MERATGGGGQSTQKKRTVVVEKRLCGEPKRKDGQTGSVAVLKFLLHCVTTPVPQTRLTGPDKVLNLKQNSVFSRCFRNVIYSF